MHRVVRSILCAVSAGLLTGSVAMALPTAVAHASADAFPTQIVSPAQGAVVRGTGAVLKVYQLAVNGGGCDTVDSNEWWVDGHPVDDRVIFQNQGVDDIYSIDNPPGLPSGTYSVGIYGWDTTGLSDGTHTLTYAYTVMSCTGENPQYVVSEDVQVNNAPIGLSTPDRSGMTVSGSAHLLKVDVQPQGSPITSLTFGGDLVPAAQQTDHLAPYSAMLDIFDAHNGAHTVTVTAHDAAGVHTSGALTLYVHNVSKLTLSGPKRLSLGGDITLHIANSTRFATGQKLLIQQKVLGAWTTVQHVALSASGRLAVTNSFRSAGHKYFRVVTASTNFWPGSSNIYQVVVS